MRITWCVCVCVPDTHPLLQQKCSAGSQGDCCRGEHCPERCICAGNRKVFGRGRPQGVSRGRRVVKGLHQNTALIAISHCVEFAGLVYVLGQAPFFKKNSWRNWLVFVCARSHSANIARSNFKCWSALSLSSSRSRLSSFFLQHKERVGVEFATAAHSKKKRTFPLQGLGLLAARGRSQGSGQLLHCATHNTQK